MDSLGFAEFMTKLAHDKPARTGLWWLVNQHTTPELEAIQIRLTHEQPVRWDKLHTIQAAIFLRQIQDAQDGLIQKGGIDGSHSQGNAHPANRCKNR